MEKVNHPDHYNIPGKKECIEQMREDYGEYITAVFCLTSAYKYLYRAGTKPGETRDEDISKAKWYCGYMSALNIDYSIDNEDILSKLTEEVFTMLYEGES